MNDDLKLLTFIHENTEMKKSCLAEIIPQINDTKIVNILKKQLSSYNNLYDLSNNKLKNFDNFKITEKKEKILKDFKINLKLLINYNPNTIIELLLRNSTIKSIDITKKIKEYPGASRETLTLANKLLLLENIYQKELTSSINQIMYIVKN